MHHLPRCVLRCEDHASGHVDPRFTRLALGGAHSGGALSRVSDVVSISAYQGAATLAFSSERETTSNLKLGAAHVRADLSYHVANLWVWERSGKNECACARVSQNVYIYTRTKGESASTLSPVAL
jgi:hypothetical protein